MTDLTKKTLQGVLASALFCGALTSCGTTGKTTADNALGGEWLITQVNGHAIDAESNDNEAYLGFNLQENKMYGCAGCNRIFGGMETDAEKKTLKMGNVGCTQMMCRNMDNERAVLQALEKTATFSISKGNKLTLKSNDGKTVMTLKRRNK